MIFFLRFCRTLDFGTPTFPLGPLILRQGSPWDSSGEKLRKNPAVHPCSPKEEKETHSENLVNSGKRGGVGGGGGCSGKRGGGGGVLGNRWNDPLSFY